MPTRHTSLAGLLLIFPAALFMAALVLRDLVPVQHQLARDAQLLIMWYAGRIWTLWVLLLALPLIVLILGCSALLGHWADPKQRSRQEVLANMRWDGPTLLIAATTFAAGAILARVVLHMLAN